MKGALKIALSTVEFSCKVKTPVCVASLARLDVLKSDWNYLYKPEEGVIFATAGDANFSAESPLPKFGRGLGKIDEDQWINVVQRGTA